MDRNIRWNARLWAMGALLALAAVCAPAYADSVDGAQQTVAQSDMAQIYLCRWLDPSTLAMKMLVVIDNETIGELDGGTYIARQLNPGKHMFSIRTGDHLSTIEETLKAGTEQYLLGWPGSAWAGSKGVVDEMDLADGRECVQQGKPAAKMADSGLLLEDGTAISDYSPAWSEKRKSLGRVEDVSAVPYLDEKGRAAYKEYLKITYGNKAFAVAKNGQFHWDWFSPEKSSEGSTAYIVLAKCRELAKQQCVVYAINDQVVWRKESQAAKALDKTTAGVASSTSPAGGVSSAGVKTVAAGSTANTSNATTPTPPVTAASTQNTAKPTPAPAPVGSGYAAIDDVTAVPYLTEQGRNAYREYLGKDAPKAFAISSNGGAYSVWGKTRDLSLPAGARERALVLCERVAKRPCELYAVDSTVVWVKP